MDSIPWTIVRLLQLKFSIFTTLRPFILGESVRNAFQCETAATPDNVTTACILASL